MGNFLALGDRVASAKAEEGESRIKVLQESGTSSVRHSQFKVVHIKSWMRVIPLGRSVALSSVRILPSKSRIGTPKHPRLYNFVLDT